MIKHTITALMLSTGAAFAHSGHVEAAAQGDAHWLLQADHLSVVALGAVAVGLLLRRALQVRRAQNQEA